MDRPAEAIEAYNRCRKAFAALLIASTPSAWAAPYAYIAETGYGTVSVIDTATNRVVSTVEVGHTALGVAVDPAGARIYVSALDSDTVSVIDATTNTVAATVAVGAGPGALAMSPDGRFVYIALLGTERPGTTVQVLDTATNVVAGSIAVGEAPFALAVSPDGRRLYASNVLGPSISVIDTASRAVVATIPMSGGPGGIAVHPSGARLYVTIAGSEETPGNSVAVIDTASLQQVSTIGVGTRPFAIAINPAGTRAYATNFGTDASPGSTVSEIDLATHTVSATIAVGRNPEGVAVHPQGHRVYIASLYADSVSVIDAATRGVVATVPVGVGPVAWGSFVGPASAPAPNLPGPRSGLWWNEAESGWGVHFTERRNVIFAAWYAYDAAGNPKWYVAPNCTLAGNTCSGAMYEVSGPRFFDVAFDPGRAVIVQAGNLQVAFQGNGGATMSYTAAGVSRTVPISRQVFRPALTAGPDFTDLWWNPAESGWGLAITHQADVMFLAWYVYDAAGRPVWYVAPNCAIEASGCSGALYRTTGPPAGPAFDPAQVRAVEAGTVGLFFPDSGTGTIKYTVDGFTTTKSIRRQFF